MIIIFKNRLTKNKWEIQFHAVNILTRFFAKSLGSTRETTTKGEEMLGPSCTPAPYWTSPFVRAGMSSRSMRTKFLRGKIYFSKRGRLMARHESRNFKVAELRSCNVGGFHTMSTSIPLPTSPITIPSHRLSAYPVLFYIFPFPLLG